MDHADADGADGAPPLPPAPGGGTLPALLDQLDDLERHLAAQHNLREYGLLQPMAAYREGGAGLALPHAQQLLRAMARHTARRAPAAGASQWLDTREDMVQLREAGCPALPAELPCSEWMQALLLGGQFRLAADSLRGSEASPASLTSETAAPLVLAAAAELFNSAASAQDTALQHAQQCLGDPPGFAVVFFALQQID